MTNYVILDEATRKILNAARAADETSDDEAFVVRLFANGKDYQVLATNAPIGLFMEPMLCAMPEVVSTLNRHYSDEYADHEPWLIILREDGGIPVMPILPPRVKPFSDN